MKGHQRQIDRITRIAVAGLFFSALVVGTLPLTTDAFAQTPIPAGFATAKLPAVEPLRDSELPPLPARLHSIHKRLAKQAQDAVRVCDDKAIAAAIEAMERYGLIREASGDAGNKQDLVLEKYKFDIVEARRKCKKRASDQFFADAITATRIRYQLSKMNDAIGRCDRAAYQRGIDNVISLLSLREEDIKKASKRGDVGEETRARRDVTKFHEIITNLYAYEQGLFQDCPPQTEAAAGATPPAPGKQVKVETGGGGGRCVITEGGSVEELKVGEKPGGQTASPPKAPAPPSGKTAETPKTPAAPPKKTAETPKTPAPPPESKTAEIPKTPAKKTPPGKPPGGPTPEKTASPPTGETTIFVKASDTVAFGNGAGTKPLAGAVIRLAGLGTTPALPQQGATRTAEAENNGASSSPAQCHTDGNGQCIITVDTNDFVDPNDDTGKPAAKPSTKTVANDPTDPIDLPDKQDKGSDFNPPKKTAANDPTDPIDLPDKQDKGSDFNPPKQAAIPDNMKVGVNFNLPNTSPATATLELKTKRNDSVVVKGAAARPNAPKKQGRLDDRNVLRLIRVAAANVLLASVQSMNDAGGVKLAQRPPQNGATDRAVNPDVRPPPGTEVTVEKIKVGDREYFRINGRGFGDGALAEWVKKTWGFTVIVDPCRDPQPGPPIGMTPQQACDMPKNAGPTMPGGALPAASIRLTALRSPAIGSGRP